MLALRDPMGAEDQPQTTLRLIAGGGRDDPPAPAIVVAVKAA